MGGSGLSLQTKRYIASSSVFPRSLLSQVGQVEQVNQVEQVEQVDQYLLRNDWLRCGRV